MRYPRGAQLFRPCDFRLSGRPFDLYGGAEATVAVVTYGRLFSFACLARLRLEKRGISLRIVKLNRIKPVDDGAVRSAAGAERVFFFEEGIRQGGVGERFGFLLSQSGFRGRFYLHAIEGFVAHATMAESLNGLGLDDAGMERAILTECGAQ